MPKPIAIMLPDKSKYDRPDKCPACSRSLADARLLEGGYVGKLNRQCVRCDCGQEIRMYGRAMPRNHAAHEESQRKVRQWQNMAKQSTENAEMRRKLDEVYAREEAGLRKLLARITGGTVHAT